MFAPDTHADALFLKLPKIDLSGNTFQLPSALSKIQSDPAIASILRGPDNKLQAIQALEHHGVRTTKFQNFYRGLEVVGSLSLLHEGPAGSDISNLLSRFDLSLRPSISAEDAAGIARAQTGDRLLMQAPTLKILPIADSDSAHLVFWIQVKEYGQNAGRDLIINAHSGVLIADISHEIEIAPIDVFSASDKCQKVNEGASIPEDLQHTQCDQPVVKSKIVDKSDSSVLRAWVNSRKVLNYYKNTQGRDSFDDRGSELVSVVHVGKQMPNAFWNSELDYMAYGDGDGTRMTDLTQSLDVAGHEMTHGVTSKTAQLIYMSESGALNEAFSDFFGVMIANPVPEKTEWAIGKKIFLNERKLLGLRNLKDPGSIQAKILDDLGNKVEKPYPAHVKDKFVSLNPCSSDNDRCFVHYNSMIPGHAAYLVHEAIGREKSEKLFYLVLTQYLNKTASFKVFKGATLKACRQLYDRQTCSNVTASFKAVGL